MKEQTTVPHSLTAITEQLDAEIIFGHLRPHQELIEDALMQRFNAKRHVIRSAIQALVDRGIVIKSRGKSARVKDFSQSEVKELYQMRELLQREAILQMPFPLSTTALTPLKKTHKKYIAAATAAKDLYLIHQLNDQFHRELFALCANRTLCSAIDFYSEATNPIRSYGIAHPPWLVQAIKEHSEMINALEQADRATLARLVVDHIRPTRQRWEKHIHLISHHHEIITL